MENKSNIQFAFFIGPFLLNPEIVERSKYTRTTFKDKNYVIYEQNKIPIIGYRFPSYIPLDIANDILTRIQMPVSNNMHLPIYTEKVAVEDSWKPPSKLDYSDEWLSLMIDTDKQIIIGYYLGRVYEDNFNRLYSGNSYINIRPDYKGKGLCKYFAQYTYSMIAQVMKVSYICINIVVPENISGVCRCYIQAGLNLGYVVYGSRRSEYGKYETLNINSCDMSEIKYLIFLIDRDIIDEEMIHVCSP